LGDPKERKKETGLRSKTTAVLRSMMGSLRSKRTARTEDDERSTFFGQQQVLVFKEKEEWLLGAVQSWCSFALC
jgi:hypothetical protein